MIECSNSNSFSPAQQSQALRLIDSIEADLCRDHLAAFVSRAWRILEPATPLIWNWHLNAICEHLEAVTNCQIQNLLINVPPGHMKSLIVSVFWPAWEWLKAPALRGLFSSYAMELAMRDSMKCRDLVTSDWYAGLKGDPWELRQDRNNLSLFHNTASGFRLCLSVGGRATGFRGQRLITDDPLNARETYSDKARAEVLYWWDKVMSSRLADPRTAAKVIIMQRLHQEDLSGHVLDLGGYEHLCLPSEYEPGTAKTTGIGWRDPRSVPGELLFPELFTRAVIEQAKKDLGPVDYAGQHQQDPVPGEGAMFGADMFPIVDAVPAGARRVRYWDKAGTEGAGAYTVGVKMAEAAGIYYVEDVVRGQWGSHNRNEAMKGTTQLDGVSVPVWFEREPGSGGKESAQITLKELAGYNVHEDLVTGDKATRARPYSAQAQAGNVRLVRGPWNHDYVAEHIIFPNGKYKDQVDASSGAFNKLALPKQARFLLTGANA